MPKFRDWFKKQSQKTESAPATRQDPSNIVATADTAQIVSVIDADIAELEKSHDERAHLRDPGIKWPLLRQAYLKRKNVVEPKRVKIENFRRQKGFFLKGNQRVREFRFDDKGISRDMLDLAAQEIDDDERESKEPLKVQYRRERQKTIADVTEALFVDMAQCVFGDDVQVVMPTEYDDRRNSLDLLLVFRDAKGDIDQILGLDFTSAYEQEFVDKKIIQAIRSIIRGKLSTALYVSAESKKGQTEYFTAQGIPRAIIGMSPTSVLLMAKGWLASEKGNTPDLLGSERRKTMLYAVLEQFRAQLILSKEKDKIEGLTTPSFATGELQRAYDRINGIIRGSHLDDENIKQKTDRTFQRIRDTVRSLSRMKNELYPKALQIQAELDERYAREKSAEKRQS